MKIDQNKLENIVMYSGIAVMVLGTLASVVTFIITRNPFFVIGVPASFAIGVPLTQIGVNMRDKRVKQLAKQRLHNERVNQLTEQRIAESLQ